MSATDWKSEWKWLVLLVGMLLAAFYLPVGQPRFDNAVMESLALLKEYAQQHVLLCLVPALFIAGAIGVFVSQASVMKYLGPNANRILAYGVASVSGTVLAVCSCTVLPLFAGIYRMGAGIGPATAFLYSGPAINVLAIFLTARVLGFELGVARAVGAIGFSVVIGLLMHLIYRKEEQVKAEAAAQMPEPRVARPLWQNASFFGAMVAVLVFANWAKPAEASGVWQAIYSAKWPVTAIAATGFGLMLVLWLKVKWWAAALAATPALALALLVPGRPMPAFAAAVIGLTVIISTHKGEAGEWFDITWGFAKQIIPLLFAGVLVAGLLLGRQGHEGLIPGRCVQALVGGKADGFLQMTGMSGSGAEGVVRALWPVWANLFASISGAFMYFATLTEVPIVQGLLGAGMGKGPALALLLAGPALSLPSMLVLRSIMGARKTIVYVSLVVVMATISGLIYGAL